MDYHDDALASGKECLEAALDYLARGWSVLGLCPPDHVGVGKAHGDLCDSPGKVPWPDGGTWRRWQDERPDEATVRRWWTEHPLLNVGLALGPVSGLVRIDVEGEAGRQLLLEKSGGDLPDTLEFVSGRKDGTGRGLLYTVPPGVELRTTHESRGPKQELRFQARGAQTVLPPSRHKDGGRYAWLPGHGPGEIEPAPAPAWLLEALASDTPRGERNAIDGLADGELIPVGKRDDTLTSFAGTMRKRGIHEEAILAAIEVVNRDRCDPPLPDEQVRKIARSVAGYAPDKFEGVRIKFPTPEPSVNGVHKHPSADDLTEEEQKQDATAADLIRINATIRWAWPGWLQIGVLNIIASEPGVGKTRLCLDLARRVYHGLTWPDGKPATLPIGSKTLWVASDNQHPQLGTVPTVFGFPPESLFLNTTRSDPFGGTMLDEPADLKEFEKRIERIAPGLVIVDTTLHATDRTSHKPEDAKAFFSPLLQIAARQGCCLVGVTHLNAAGKPLGRRVQGHARVVMQLEKPDPENQPDRRKFYVVKSTDLYPAPLGVTMGEVGNEYDLNPPVPVDGPIFTGPSPKLQEAIDWLRKLLAAGPKRVSEIRTLADQKGVSTAILYKARDAIGVNQYKTEGYQWWGLTPIVNDRSEVQ